VFIFKWEVTLGDIALGLLGILFSFGMWLYHFWLPRHPFVMRFYDKPWDSDEDENPSSDYKIIRCNAGEPHTVLIGLQLRTERVFETVDIRLVRRDLAWLWRWGFLWKEPHRAIAKVTKLTDQQFPWDGEDKDNKKGGREANYPKPISFPRGGVMWYAVTVAAQTDWIGWLSFQLRRGSSHKGTARASICFKVHGQPPGNDRPHLPA
jgi:hypothetical protein